MAAKIILIVAILLILAVGVMLFDSNRFVIREYTVKSKKISKDYDFLLISDLHCKEYGKNNKKLFEKLDTVNADFCIIPGDMITAVPGKSTASAVSFLERLHERMPVFYSYGNHEYRAKIYEDVYGDMFEKYRESLSKADVKLSDNDKNAFEELDIYMLTIDKKYYRRFKTIEMDSSYIEELLGKVNKDRFSILLAHNPDYFSAYSEWGADLTVSGHVHGGIIRLPIIGGLLSPKVSFFPKYSLGLYIREQKKMLVSAGLGNHSIPFRFLNPGEISVIHLKKD